MSEPAGMTGTQEGLTGEQTASALFLIKFLNISSLHHGDCIGADEQLDAIARSVGLHRTIHPPINQSKEAFCYLKIDEGLFNKFDVLPPKEYLDRNHDIVDDTKLLLAFPKGPEELRSGTWATIRYAKKSNSLVIVVWPDGKMELQ